MYTVPQIPRDDPRYTRVKAERLNYHAHADITPYTLNQLPAAITSLMPKRHFMPISVSEAEALLWLQSQYYDTPYLLGGDLLPDPVWHSGYEVTKRLDTLMARVGVSHDAKSSGRWHVRLNSGSLGDTPSMGHIVDHPLDAISQIARSERAAVDLMLDILNKRQSRIVLSEPLDIEPWQEWRLFIRSRQPIALSARYPLESINSFPHCPMQTPELAELGTRRLAQKVCSTTVASLAASWPADDVVVDLVAQARYYRPNDPDAYDWLIRLLDVHPYHPGVSPGLFLWSELSLIPPPRESANMPWEIAIMYQFDQARQCHNHPFAAAIRSDHQTFPVRRCAWQIVFDRSASVVDINVVPPSQPGGPLKIEPTTPKLQLFVAAHTPEAAIAVANRTNPHPKLLKFSAICRADISPIAATYPADAEVPLTDVLGFGISLPCWHCGADVTNATINPVWETDDDGSVVGVYCADCSAEYRCDTGIDADPALSGPASLSPTAQNGT